MFQRVIVSTDDSNFREFWPIVSMAWKKFFPERELHCAFVSSRESDDQVVMQMKSHGHVHIFPVIDGVPTASQGKMARLILASTFEEGICLIDDIDSIPLQSNYINQIFSEDVIKKIQEGFLMALGANVYQHTNDSGKFPMGYITAKGSTFKRIINPHDKTIRDLYEEWKENKIDGKESVLNVPIEKFSDESLLRYLIKQNPVPVVNVERNYDIRKYWIDRSWWGFDQSRLENFDYVMCNFLRPLDEGSIEKIIEFLKK